MSCAVYFNLDGVLTDHSINYEQVFLQAVQEAGLDSMQDGYEQYTDRFFDYFQRGWTYPRRQAILDMMTDKGIDDTGQSDRFATAWEDAEAEQTTVRPGAADLVTQLSKTYTVGVITNGTSRLQRAKLDKVGIADVVDATVISSEIGAVKPMPEMFETAKNAVDADTYVIVSQDLRRDLLPAKREDYKTVWLSTADPDDRLSDVVDRQVASLEEIMDAVTALC